MRNYSELTARLQAIGRYRQFREVSCLNAARARIDDREVLLFSSNDYLNLAKDARIRDAASEAINRFGLGSGASRYITGNHPLYKQLENETACIKQQEDCLVYPTGFMTNLGVISALSEKGDLVFSDELNHASIIDACRLSHAEIKIFPHRNYEILEEMLEETPCPGQRFLVSESLFSIAGTTADIPRLAALKSKFDALLIIDDAHACGAIGECGGGLTVQSGVAQSVDITVGTYSKAYGGLGGFACGKNDLIEYIRNTSRNLIYTTALPAAVTAANLRALEISSAEWQNMQRSLNANVNLLQQGLRQMGIEPQARHYIQPVKVGKDEEVVRLSSILLEAGILVWPIRPPTVPEGRACLRISLSLAHGAKDIEKLCQVLKENF
ncbi:aminotransferase class I/II-fold pyridoxal phosphate-dependent enzyme [Planctomycetota bacterium]